jgi:hypothetical protein
VCGCRREEERELRVHGEGIHPLGFASSLGSLTVGPPTVSRSANSGPRSSMVVLVISSPRPPRSQLRC